MVPFGKGPTHKKCSRGQFERHAEGQEGVLLMLELADCPLSVKPVFILFARFLLQCQCVKRRRELRHLENDSCVDVYLSQNCRPSGGSMKLKRKHLSYLQYSGLCFVLSINLSSPTDLLASLIERSPQKGIGPGVNPFTRMNFP